jgi:hypothetical protein
MSKIALSGNASGTGTFTIASPNSNSDRTLNLPDAAGVMYAQGNILGTVSQSGGVPTGAIIEQGSNANGNYVRYADGTMFCWGQVTRTLGIDASTYLGGFRSGGGSFDFTFPSTFSAAPNLIGTPNENSSWSPPNRPSTTSTTTGSFLLTAVTSQGSADRTVAWTAVGRWF